MEISKAIILPLFCVFVVPVLSAWSAQDAACSTPEVCSIKAQLQKKPDYLLLRDLAEKGPMGREAGSVVAALLDHPDWAIREKAARALGFIDYPEAIPYLGKLLNDPANAVLSLIAAESLGRIGDQRAIDFLEPVAESHWFPAVRNAAKTAIFNIEHNRQYPKQHPNASFADVFFDYLMVENYSTPRPKLCSELAVPFAKNNLFIKRYQDTENSSLAAISYRVISRGSNSLEQTNPDAIERYTIVLDASNQLTLPGVRYPQEPNVTLKVGGGWLAGLNLGEWGGELVFLSDLGTSSRILSEPIADIFQLGSRNIAITDRIDGFDIIYEIKRSGDNQWSATPWRRLPDSMFEAKILASGELMVNTNVGSLQISSDGQMRMASCKAYYPINEDK